MKDFVTLSKLYYLLIHADGAVNEKETVLGKKMIQIEGMDLSALQRELQLCEKKSDEALIIECVEGLRKLPIKVQINYIAWLCLIANSDGFMDKREWDLIYKIYKKNLNLNLDDIMTRQRELNMLLNSKLHLA